MKITGYIAMQIYSACRFLNSLATLVQIDIFPMRASSGMRRRTWTKGISTYIAQGVQGNTTHQVATCTGGSGQHYTPSGHMHRGFRATLHTKWPHATHFHFFKHILLAASSRGAKPYRKLNTRLTSSRRVT